MDLWHVGTYAQSCRAGLAVVTDLLAAIQSGSHGQIEQLS
jgi:hypothetical protein